ncbi:similar to Saccharomyces cerevisiae YMR071C TVP18 Integral membrane protein localized to late Golgi vesicles along with the v-SNARE Tlg2p [Maudiozyma saulgeensis]|uniref:Golgi apparatus membrane protein TVP18 n=1 Tax=Maudiozyma saulgeensis TaxID=1789683 RepID=A0A1X7R7Z6_9SACH|nr:similar to Saccharomyces cerevisiae YMR071C TVP18 Integral membrane protein localized to late Golgi vesicles along with the v-SNARE Tlg2p [Kazachstania saulgeensis]
MALSIKQFINVAGMVKDLKSFNFSVYGRWFGYINIILCIALGIANLFHVNAVVAFGVIAIVQGVVILFIEVPFLLKICPMSDNFIEFIKKFETNGWRCVFYLVNAIIQYCSIALMATSLIVCAVGLTISAMSYAVAFSTKQEFQNTHIIKSPTDDDFPHEAVVREML